MDGRADSLNPHFNEYPWLLSLTSLFQGDFSIHWIEELTEKKASWILIALQEEIKDGYLIRKEPGIFCFANSSEQQKLQNLLPPHQKEQLHRKIANILMRELPEDNSKAQAVAHHILCITNDEKGCRLLVRAGDIFFSTFRIEEALRCYTKALHDLSSYSGEVSDNLFAKTAIKYSKISTARHNTNKVLSVLNEAMERAKRCNNKSSLALLEMHIAKNEWLRYRYSSALRHFERGWSLAKEMNDPKLLRSASIFRISFLYWHGRYREVLSSYEQFVPEVENYPIGRFPLLALIIVARCYASSGQFTQGLGMLDAIRTHCEETGDGYMAAQAGMSIGAAMLDIRRIPDAFQYLTRSVEEAIREHNDWIHILGMLMLAYAYYLDEDQKHSLTYLRKFIKYCKEVRVTVPDFPYFLELCWAMEQKKLPHIPSISFKNELNRMIRAKNLFIKGVAYRYKALLQKKEGLPHEKILQSLNLSLKWLGESGHQIELARSKLELSRQYLLLGDERKAEETALIASKILSPFDAPLIPDDLRSLTKEPLGKNILKEILKMGQEVVTIRNNKELSQHIISTVNRIAGAERGAIFLLKGSTTPPLLQLKASKNLTSAQVNDASFQSSLKLIEEVAITGKGRILGTNLAEGLNSSDVISSRICVPMILRDKIIGILYNDNRLLSSAFQESDIELLSYFAALSAFAMDNIKAYEEIQHLNENLREEKSYYEEQHLQSIHFEDIVGDSLAIKRVLAQVQQVAATETTVLILGETGVGKELVARAIHRQSPRRDKPFIQVHCSALPDSLIPSELFGHEKGAFTGALQRRIGRFELANGGTIFLDEIGDLPLEIQVRLLGVLQSKEFERVGGSETQRSDFRLVTATNRDLEKRVNEQKFRADLYYRINVFPIYVPPLRERKEDIPLLAHYFLRIYSKKMGKSLEKIPKACMHELLQYDWPGNVRELENIIERGSILSQGPYFKLPELNVGDIAFAQPEALATLKENEHRHIQGVLQKMGWKIRGPGGAAELLDIHPSTLESRMKKLGLQKPRRSSVRK